MNMLLVKQLNCGVINKLMMLVNNYGVVDHIKQTNKKVFFGSFAPEYLHK